MNKKKPKIDTYKDIILPNIENIKKWKEEGNNLKEIAKKLKITDNQLYGHMKKTELTQALGFSREILIEKLKNTLYDKALGNCKSKKTIIDQKHEYRLGEFVLVSEKKHIEIVEYCPDLGALIFCLCNLDPENWKRSDREEVLNDIKIILHDTIINAKKESQKLLNEAKNKLEEVSNEGS